MIGTIYQFILIHHILGFTFGLSHSRIYGRFWPWPQIHNQLCHVYKVFYWFIIVSIITAHSLEVGVKCHMMSGFHIHFS